MIRSTTGVVIALGSAQTLAWASSFYLPAVLAAPMAREFGLATSSVFAAFSLSLVIAALVGPAAGRRIDRLGGRGLLMATNGLFALGLAGLATAQGFGGLLAGFALLGLAMGAGLYEAAFAALVRLFGSGSRNPITGITLIAGFASTVGWPLSAWMGEAWGWRGACLGWAALHLVLGLPLNAMLPRAGLPAPDPSGGAPATPAASMTSPPATGRAPDAATTAAVLATEPPSASPAPHWHTVLLLAAVFATSRFVSTGIAAHLPGLLMALGATLAAAVAAGALVGPAQVAGRLLEFGLLRQLHPLVSARLAGLGPPLGLLALLLFGVPAAVPFALLHGAGNGVLTIAKGTLPLVIFGPQGYGARQGWLSMPALLLQPLAPWLFGLALERSAAGLIGLALGVSGSALAGLVMLRMPRR